MTDDNMPERTGIILSLLAVVIIYSTITCLQWFLVPNYDGCANTGDVYWCYENSRYTLVETIANQIKWVASLRVI